MPLTTVETDYESTCTTCLPGSGCAASYFTSNTWTSKAGDYTGATVPAYCQLYLSPNLTGSLHQYCSHDHITGTGIPAVQYSGLCAANPAIYPAVFALKHQCTYRCRDSLSCVPT